MPHEDPLEKVVEAAGEVAEAVEKTGDTDPPPSSGADTLRPPPPMGGHPPSKHQQIRQAIHLITSVTALLAAVGAFLKTCDHSVTENSYSHLSESIQTLSENQQKQHDDIVALHGYLDGLAHAPVAAAPPPPVMVDAGAPATSATTLLVPAHPVPTATTAMNTHDAGLITFAIEAPPLPSVHSTVANIPPPPFAQAAAAPAAAAK